MKLVHHTASLAGLCEDQSTYVPSGPSHSPCQQVCSACLCSCKERLEFGEAAELTNLKVSAWSVNLLLSFQLNFVLLLQLYLTVTFTSLVSSVVALVPALQVLWALCQLHAVGQEWGALGLGELTGEGLSPVAPGAVAMLLAIVSGC